MGSRFRRHFDVAEHDVQRLMNCIVEHASPDEARDVERVLSVLATILARLDREPHGDSVTFAAPPGTAPLVERALEAMARSDRHEARRRRMLARTTI